MLNVKGLSYQWPAGSRVRYPNFEVAAGEIMLLLGGSGSGKTTLLHLIGGLLKYQTGSVQMNGTELTTLSPVRLDRFRGKNIGFIFQKHFLQPSLSVNQNLQMPGWLTSNPVSGNELNELLNRLGLTGRGESAVNQLSHGQQQRVAIGRALIHKPSLILADEPTSALDDINCFSIIRLMRDLASHSGSALVIATHDHRLKELSDHTITL